MPSPRPTPSSPTSAASRPRRCGRSTASPGIERYVGGHPMAGSERSGPLAASADAVRRPPVGGDARTRAPSAAATAAVEELARLAGASVVRLSPEEHDVAVARTSHLPHLLSVLVAGRLADAPADHLALSGQGVRDVTRVAGGDPVALAADRHRERRRPSPGCSPRSATSSTSSSTPSATGDRGSLGEILERGVAGTRAIPGKHGGPSRPTASVFVSAARPPRRAGPAVRGRRRQRRQHRGRPHRPRPRPRHRPGRAPRRRDPRRPPADLSRSPAVGRPTARLGESRTGRTGH